MKDLETVNKIIELLEEMHPEAACALNHGSSFELLIAVVLSAHTTDVSVNRVTPALFEKYPSPEALASADPSEVAEIIKTVGLYNTKSSNIVKLAQKLVSDYDGQVPSNFEDLTGLPGVGRKTANVVLAEAFGVPALAVDTHVFRVSGRIGLSDAGDAAKTEEQLRQCIPREKWIRAHHLLIFHGRKICRARGPKCGECLLGDYCDYRLEEKARTYNADNE